MSQNNNVSGLNNIVYNSNSRRNISLTGGAFTSNNNYNHNNNSNAIGSGGGSRPKTAAMPGLTGMPRPPTAAHNFGKRTGHNMTAGGVYSGLNFISTNPHMMR